MKQAMDRCWAGRVDAAEGNAGRRWHQIVAPLSPATPRGTVAISGFACDAGVARNQGRVGAAAGPAAIRTALANLPVHECRQLADGGDVVCVGDDLEHAQSELADELKRQLDRGLFPIVLGGGHEIAYASFNGLAGHLEGKGGALRIGVINFDAHFDLRRAERANSGTPFLQIAESCEARGWPFRYCCLGISRTANTAALFERAQSLDVLWRLDEQLTGVGLVESQAMLARFIGSVDYVYLTLCLDALPAAIAPGVSAPAARGIGLDVIEPLVDDIVRSGKLALADIAEMNPRYDIDGRTARVAARLAARIANGVALRSA
jgi:formiminoglutamase